MKVGTTPLRTLADQSVFRDVDAHGCPVLYALKAISLYSEVAALADRIGAEMFEPEAPRAVAAMLVSNNRAPFEALCPRERERAVALIQAVRRCTIEIDPVWGLHLVRIVAERRAKAIVAATLRWAAERIAAGDRPVWVMKKVLQVLRLVGYEEVAP